MRLPDAAITAVAAGVLGATLLAQTPAPTPFRFERPIVTAEPGPRRLPLDVALVAGGSPFSVRFRVPGDPDAAAVATGGLADLRLFDEAGAEIPHLLVASPDAAPVWREAAALLPVAGVETERQRTSGFEADLGAAVLVDRFRLDRLPPPFLKRVRLEGSGDRAHWTLLVDEGTVFDLPQPGLRQVELGFVPGSYRYFRVTWDDSRSGRIGPPLSASARIVSDVVPAAALTAAVIVERRPSEPGRSRFHLRLPGARLPIVALDLDVAPGHLMRDAEVFEARLTGAEATPALIGRGTLKRVEEASITAEALRIHIQPPVEPELDLVIDDGNNSPLELRGVTARFAELPWIYFESKGTALARYGNSTLPPPRYDLEAVRPSLRIEQVPEARWGEPRTRTDVDNQASAADLPTRGAAIDAAKFKYVRDIPSGEPGMVALRLDEAALAHSRGIGSRFGDVRVIGEDGLQVPYLVERSSEPLSVDVKLERLNPVPASFRARPSETIYGIAWPHERLSAARLVLTTNTRVFRRRVNVAAERQPDRLRRDPWIETLVSAEWVNATQEAGAPALTLLLPDTVASQLFVVVDEGDNSVLPIASGRLLFPQYRLRFFRESQTTLRLAYGQAELAAPSYDLALLAPRLLGVSATEVAAGAERVDGSSASTEALLSPRFFWAVVGAAVVVLVFLIVRLIRTTSV
jgi:hypothetical protein